jgi:hypothetical protein
MSDLFDELCDTGVLEELPPETERAAARAMPAEPFALQGCVITPDRRLDDGYVVTHGATIESVGATKPADVRSEGRVNLLRVGGSPLRARDGSLRVPGVLSAGVVG